jgi:hypothetical protein
MLDAILSRVSAILGVVESVLGITQSLQARQNQTAIETTPGEILLTVVDTKLDVENASTGLVAIAAKVDNLEALVNLNQLALLAAIAAAQQGGVPVTLPATTPSGGAWLDVGNANSSIWNVPLNGDGQTGNELLSDAGNMAHNLRDYSLFPLQIARYFVGQNGWLNLNANGDYSNLPDVQLSTIVSTDTVLSWLQREAPTFTWQLGVWGADTVSANSIIGDGQLICVFSPADFALVKSQLGLVATVELAPIWPGIASVTLLAPVALAVGLTITEAMDGVIVDITSVPAGTGTFTFDDQLSYRYIGAIAFVNDNGEEEFPQNLGFQHAVYCPKAMRSAAGVKCRTKPGVTGTITPWTSP